MRATRNDSLAACPIRWRLLRKCGSLRRHAQVSRKQHRRPHRLGLLTRLLSPSLSSIGHCGRKERGMDRRAKPKKGKAEAKRSLARRPPNDDSARVRDLEKRLAEALQREAEALGQLQTRDRAL